MDINDKIAARRQELADAEKRAAAEVKEAEQARKAVEERRKREALDAVAADLSTTELPMLREGDHLVLPAPEPEPFDPAEMTQAALSDLLDREARKAWSTGEQWQVIGPICAGVALVLVPFLGFPLAIFGIWRSSRIRKKHRATIIQRYPALFGTLTT